MTFKFVLTIQMTSRYAYSPSETCRVQPEQAPMMEGPGTIHRGFETHVTPYGVVYQQNGMTVSDFNRNLRLPQKRTFLGPEYFNGGCFSLYCKDSAQCPNSRLATPSPQTEALFQAAFDTPFDPATGNNAPPPCFGGNCNSYNSVTGWEITSSGKLRWQES